jgi:hypothetical protein
VKTVRPTPLPPSSSYAAGLGCFLLLFIFICCFSIYLVFVGFKSLFVLLCFDLVVETLATGDQFFSSSNSFQNSSVLIHHPITCYFNCLLMGFVPLDFALITVLCGPSERTESFFDSFLTIWLYFLYCSFHFWFVVRESTYFPVSWSNVTFFLI